MGGNGMKNKSFHQLVKRYFILATTIPILLFGAYLSVTQSLHYNENMDHMVNSLFKMCETRMHDFTETNSKILGLFATDDNIKNALTQTSEQEINEVIARFDSTYSLKGSIAIGLSDGRMFTKNKAQLPDDYDPRVRPWYLSAFSTEEKVVISEPYRDAIKTDQFSVTFSTRVYSGDEESFIGVAGLDVDMAELLNFGTELSLPTGSIFILTDQKGTILAKTESAFLSNPKNVEMIIADVERPSASKKTVNLEGTHFNLYMGQQTSYGWRVMVLIPENLFMNQYGSILATSVILISFMMLISIFYAQKIDAILLTPIDYVVKQLEGIDIEGKPQIIKGLKNETMEVEIVRQAINKMLERIYEQKENLENKQVEISKQYMEIEALYEETTAMNDALNDMVDSLNDSWKQTVRVLSNAIEANDVYTRGHCDRVMEYAVRIAKQMRMDITTVRSIEFAALLHDVGKVSIPYHVLNKEEALTEDERQMIQKHPVIGYNIVEGVPFLSQTARIILYHHENYDGTGYPGKHRGEGIPLEARILSVADAFDAMTSARPYRREPMSIESALKELEKFSGTQFDPSVIAAFMNCVSEM